MKTARLTNLEEGTEPDRWQHSWDWEVVMEGLQGRAYDNPWSDSYAMMTGAGCLQGTTSPPPTWGPATPCMETMEVHMSKVELEDL